IKINFYVLSFAGRCWNDEHMYVIFYYLRKKDKYDVNELFRYTTVDYIFKSRIEEIYDKYAHKDGDISVGKEEDVICEYIKGLRLIANVPWHTMDAVVIPFNCRDRHHWILVIFHLRYRSIRIYDSY
ncbi:hypothetical protein HAX54_010464, partial [Datura stramonium]|nr:hypothetical protein [Datura stramonium]